MEKLLEELLQRWERAFDELQLLPGYKSRVKTTQYSEGSRYDLKRFDWSTFPSSGPMVKNKEELNTESLYEYGFNDEGHPCYVAFGHNYNQVNWEGFYTYCDAFVEYVEFSVDNGVPSMLTRIGYQDGRKVSLQHIFVNGRGGGHFLAQMSKEDIVRKLRNDKSSLFLTVTSYEYGATNRIERASSINIGPGSGKYTTYDEYSYDENLVLDTIRTFYEGGINHLAYSRAPENMVPELLIESLAEAMAMSISDTLASLDVKQPIALLELNYHYADNYIPSLVWQSAQEVAEKLKNKEIVFMSDYRDVPQAEIKSFERLFAQMEQVMEDRDNMDLGRSMLRKAAFLLTKNKLFGKLNATEDFVAYAVDWSIEGFYGGEFEAILRECGVEKETIDIWQQMGMFLE